MSEKPCLGEEVFVFNCLGLGVKEKKPKIEGRFPTIRKGVCAQRSVESWGGK